MARPLFFWLRYFIFWMLFFAFFRVLFIMYINPFTGQNHQETWYSLIAGFRLDWSVFSYLFVLPVVVLTISSYINSKITKNILLWYHILVSAVFIMLFLANIMLFKAWGTLINNRALAYVAQPAEMLASATNLQLGVVLFILILLLYTSIRTFTMFMLPLIQPVAESLPARITAFSILLVITGIGIRGGVQQIPINESAAVYSKNTTLNQIAINPIWYLGHNLEQSGLNETNPYAVMGEHAAELITHSLLQKNESDSVRIFNLTSKPNVVIILLESWTADIIEPLGGYRDVTPNFTSLSSEGLLFTNIYSSGFRTDQALVSVLSGFPSQPNNSIIRFPGKVNQLPSLANELKKQGYHNSFYYGGELGFANMNGYLYTTGYDQISSIDDFDGKNLNSKWGAHDEFVLTRQANDLNGSPQPFFSTLLTLSTHEPFEVPVETPFTGTEEKELFKKAAWYTDKCLGEYFARIKKTDWYKNTIFILMADHGHRAPMQRDYFDARGRQIPLLIVSELLDNQFKGSVNNTLANQHDLASTLLHQLGLSDSLFYWSVNILDQNRHNFAYMSLDNAILWKTDTSISTIPLQTGILATGIKPEPADSVARAYLEHLYGTFMSY